MLQCRGPGSIPGCRTKIPLTAIKPTCLSQEPTCHNEDPAQPKQIIKINNFFLKSKCCLMHLCNQFSLLTPRPWQSVVYILSLLFCYSYYQNIIQMDLYSILIWCLVLSQKSVHLKFIHFFANIRILLYSRITFHYLTVTIFADLLYS